MLFNSIAFVIFFPVVTILFFLLPHRFRWMLLLIASCFFYCFFIPVYLLILFAIILIDYTAGLLIEKNNGYKKIWLLASITANLSVLGIFKYYNFFISNINDVSGTHFTLLNFILPIGLSFHTFQAMSYTIEVYKGKFPAERHLGIYALYVMFYPQLVAGPIERPQHMFPQFKKQQHFNWQNILDGVRLMLWGFFKKLVIADRISSYVAAIFNSPEKYAPVNVCIGIVLFSVQIYCDFSGYSDIAIGSAKTMGFNLMLNFNRPYHSSNLRQFWQRWHISLSSWFRDYVFIPLGGSHKAFIFTAINLLIVFFLSGLWHGAGWNFIVWGLLHGIGLIVYNLISGRNRKDNFSFIGWFVTMLFVFFSWVFFRANSFQNAMLVIDVAKNIVHDQTYIQSFSYQNFMYGNTNLLFVSICIGGMFLFEKYTDPLLLKMNKYKLGDILFCCFTIFLILFFGVMSNQSFIYFQF
ncbi:MAG: MBOAT family O-acyltransferase [Ferruginibacter sp.]